MCCVTMTVHVTCAKHPTPFCGFQEISLLPFTFHSLLAVREPQEVFQSYQSDRSTPPSAASSRTPLPAPCLQRASRCPSDRVHFDLQSPTWFHSAYHFQGISKSSLSCSLRELYWLPFRNLTIRRPSCLITFGTDIHIYFLIKLAVFAIVSSTKVSSEKLLLDH